MAIVTKVNLTLNKRLWERFNELREEAYEITGEKINFSSYANAVLKQMVDTLEVFIQKKKEGALTPDFMIEHFRKLAGAGEKRVVKEAYKQGGKRKPAKAS
jgi:protein associated with RNAse G/E